MAAINRRREARKSLQQPGWITLDGGFAARQCLVHDMSPSGAKIGIEDTNTLPAKLRLAFTRDARTGRSCQVVWRSGNTVGVKFVR
jgi:hypothetical protein